MSATCAELIAALEQTGPALQRLTAGLADDALDFRLNQVDWSIREVLAHLVDDEMYVMRLRLERIIKEDIHSWPRTTSSAGTLPAIRRATRLRNCWPISACSVPPAWASSRCCASRIGRARAFSLNMAHLPLKAG